MKTLIDYLESLVEEKLTTSQKLEIKKQSEVSVYPFNKCELYIVNLLAAGALNLEQYYKFREQYINSNKYLHVFEISAPTDFGELWAERHLNEIVPDLVKPKKEIMFEYNGEYDFILDKNIKIEVKASRAADIKIKGPLYTKALSKDSPQKFDMNFQQIKPCCCDVFVWIGVWKDDIKYWVLNSKEVSENKYFSNKQHRGNVGEGQLHIKKANIEDFKNFEVKSSELKNKILEAYKRKNE